MTVEAGQENLQIDALYVAVLKSTLDDEELQESEKEVTRAVLRTVLFSQEPVPVETIAELSGIEGPNRVEYALNALRSVLHYSDITGLVSTLHASFPDFMFDKARSGVYHCDVGEHGATLRHRCFLVMRTQLRFNICDLPSSFVPDDKVENMQGRIKSNISPPLSYACRYWANHLTMTAPSSDALAALDEFLSNQLLFWMEVTSLKRELLVGVEALLRTKRWLAGSASMPSELALLVEDAGNFYTSYAASPASQSTSHIYISSLPFCPRSSSVHTYYWPRTQGLLDLRGSLMDRRETAALATWNIGSEVLSVAYSPDGTRVAAGCSNGSVSIRNAYDGMLLVGPLQGHTRLVYSVVFSGDGRLVASGSEDRTIRVWDVRSGSRVAGPFQGHTDIVWSVSFSPDSTRIVSGSNDSTIRVWRATDGVLLLGPLHGHTDRVNCVTFSPDGALIASASRDMTIRLWHSHDGTPAASPIHGHTNTVNCVTFTPDGTRLVSASFDNTVRVWRVSDGSVVTSPFQGHTDVVSSVAVSGDGTLVASGSNDCTVRVWRLDDGTPAAGPFAGHNNWINSVVYAPDGTRVISGSYDRTMRAWNVREALAPAGSEHPPLSELKGLCFSSDGAYVVTESDDHGIQMWSVADGTCQPGSVDVRPPSSRLHDSTPDGLYTAEIDKEGNLELVIRVADETVVAGPFDEAITWVFSDDSASVIVGFLDGRIEVVDLHSGRAALHLGSAGATWVQMIAQSTDRLLLASAHCQELHPSPMLRIWSVREPPLSLQLSASHSHTFDHASPLSHIYAQCRTREDGWLVDDHHNLLLWIPSDMVDLGFSLFASLIITHSGILQVPKQRLLVGKQWAKCYINS
ncbi:Vegetative incompatibility protein HET-E-1 [Rhizoctonia solani AG-1 IB]|nr:Vegetative incompatibility protein HET-E-1 [Rhizoctonia solani AG-1 IB]